MGKNKVERAKLFMWIIDIIIGAAIIVIVVLSIHRNLSAGLIG